MVYRNEEGPFTKKDFEVKVNLPHPIVSEFITYRHCNLPIMGVGADGPNKPFLYFDKYFDKSLLKKIKSEVLAGEEKKIIAFNKIVAIGIVPTLVNGQKSVDSYIAHITKYAKDSAWIESIEKLTRRGDIKIFFHDYFNIKTAWEGIAMFRKYNGLYEDKSLPSEWLGCIEFFPLLQKFVESLPFKYVGYVMIFKSTGHNPVLIHRDYYPTNHTVNFMNFRLDQRERPFFLYDMHTHHKTYIDQSSDAYFFNEIDAHGLDRETGAGLTLRVEGQFLDSFKDQIGLSSKYGNRLENADTFNWSFEHCERFLKTGKFNIEYNTDI